MGAKAPKKRPSERERKKPMVNKKRRRACSLHTELTKLSKSERSKRRRKKNTFLNCRAANQRVYLPHPQLLIFSEDFHQIDMLCIWCYNSRLRFYSFYFFSLWQLPSAFQIYAHSSGDVQAALFQPIQYKSSISIANILSVFLAGTKLKAFAIQSKIGRNLVSVSCD